MSAADLGLAVPPPERGNPPGQPALRYRIGTWASFRRAMLDQLPRQVVPPGAAPDSPRPLAALTTRADQDPTIALLDAFACVCDVLTFYQERILNEGYLTTAVEPLSVTEIARSIGYEPAPGVAATATLAFTVDPTHSGPLRVPARQAVLSIPAQQGELPVTFETSAELEARADWNALAARPTKPQELGINTDELYLQGVNTRLAPGDPIVVLDTAVVDVTLGSPEVNVGWDLCFVIAAEPRAAEGYTLVTLDRMLLNPYPRSGVRVLTFRERGGLFGWNAPDARMMPEDIRNSDMIDISNDPLSRYDDEWVGFKFFEDLNRDPPFLERAVDLDREYASVVQGGWVCLKDPNHVQLYRVDQVSPTERVDFSLASRVTRVFVDMTERLGSFSRRGTTVLLGSEELPIAEEPDTSPAFWTTEEQLAARPEVALPPGRLVLITGVSASASGQAEVIQTTVATWVDSGDLPGDLPRVTFADKLPRLQRTSVRIHANVVAATHGGTVADEVLGSGDAGRAHQRLRLGHLPLTWVPAVSGGAASTLELRVDGLRWEPVETLHTAGPLDRSYTLQRDHDGGTVVGFGDGVHGARLPTGTENVRATYRKGIGLAGQVAAGQLSLPQNPPPGLQAAVNPAAASGAADPDAPQDIRRLAPRTVLTLDRLVSVQDYEDYAASFPGVGKARTVALWNGRRGFVHLTVAGATGEVLDKDSPTVIALLGSMATVQDPAHHVRMARHDQVTFKVDLKVLVDSAWVADDVVAAVVAALTAAFSFPERQFGQPVTAAEVLEQCHAVPGVVAVDLNELVRSDGHSGGIPGVVLAAALPTWDGTKVTRAELLLVDPAAIAVSRMDDT